ncbi:SDR family oxidoreductase [Flavobacterium agrisoli]|uniref:SDR family oxidoreductase n=1 Tax=Flavobacterium agrisoli TaxID=2793066 RepID=A0A934UJP2_9FLAO|nr:SDR family oxidoreductase [Flavobacterium agrisoli]MBK0369708.1 SDR family oxidoreductase [Flavobacterium agrisoli]
MKKQISILGCGWLGLPLGKMLLEKKYQVNGSTTSSEKLEILEKEGIKSFLIQLEEGKKPKGMTAFLKGSQALIIAIPPRLRAEKAESFTNKIKGIIPQIEKSKIENVLFISSTSVYGKSIEGLITEKSPLEPDTESGKQMLEVEALLQKNNHFATTVLRFGGLIGPDRNPVTILATKQNTDADAPINLIHLDDCLGIIDEVITQQCWGETFNAVAPNHPTRKSFYTQQAKELKVKVPKFLKKKSMAYKTISSTRLEHILDYEFKFKM